MENKIKFEDKRINIIVNKIGLSQDIANFCIAKSKKYAIWLANQIKNNISVLGKNEELDLIFDWKRNFQLVNINELTFKQALKESKVYHKSLFVKTKDSLKNRKVILNCGDFKWVQLLTEEDCLEEGRAMGHCIGGHGHNTNISTGNTIAYSLRDKYNKPHLTFEMRVKDLIVFEFKGRANSQPKAEYLQYFIELLSIIEINKITDGVFHRTVKENLEFAKLIHEKNDKLLDINLKISIGINPILKNSVYFSNIHFYNNEEITIPYGVSVFEDLNLEFSSKIIIEDNLTVGGNVDIRSKEIVIGKNLRVGGNLFVISNNLNSIPDDCKVFGSVEFYNYDDWKNDKLVFEI